MPFEEERQCPQCGEVMEGIGTEVKETLKFKPAEVYIQRNVYHAYACVNCKKIDVSTPAVKALKEPPLIFIPPWQHTIPQRARKVEDNFVGKREKIP